MNGNRARILFSIGLIARLIFLFFGGSHYLRDLFIPFLDKAVENPGANPWTLMSSEAFPYGSALFLILWIPRYLAHAVFGPVALGAGPIGLALTKLPLLGLDLLLLRILRDIEPRKTESLLLYYWLNPVLFYITYVHGQLDVASTAFCALALLLLARKRTTLSAVAMAAATLSKFHVVLLVPFMMVYVWNREFAAQARRDIGRWLAIWIPICVTGFLPLILAGTIGYATATSPEAFRIFAARIDYGHDRTLQIGVLIVLAVFGRLCLSTNITEKGLVFGSTALLSTLLLATDPMPGWYFWVLPFFALFFALYLNVPRSLFWIHNVVYFAYFLPASDPTFGGNSLASSISFTVLQASLAGILVAIYFLSIRHEARVLRRIRPTTIGIAGDSGAGKNHLSRLFEDLLNRTQTLVIEGDDYHRWERGDGNWEKYTHLDPRANRLVALDEHTRTLARGHAIEKADYSHETGRFTDARELRPAKTVILQGLHSFYLRGMRDRLDLKIFLAPDPLVRLGWKLDRDVGERGYSREKVIASLAGREKDSRTFIAPQRKLADWIVEFRPLQSVTEEAVATGERPELVLHHSVPNEPSVDRIVSVLEAFSENHDAFTVTVEPIADATDRLSIRYAGEPTREEIREIASAAFPNPRRITRGREPPSFRAGYDGLNQLMALALLESVAESEPL